jgi:hypothetical protein
MRVPAVAGQFVRRDSGGGEIRSRAMRRPRRVTPAANRAVFERFWLDEQVHNSRAVLPQWKVAAHISG